VVDNPCNTGYSLEMMVLNTMPLKEKKRQSAGGDSHHNIRIRVIRRSLVTVLNSLPLNRDSVAEKLASKIRTYCRAPEKKLEPKKTLVVVLALVERSFFANYDEGGSLTSLVRTVLSTYYFSEVLLCSGSGIIKTWQG